jgi:cyanophycin synthetase
MVELDEATAIKWALDNAPQDALVVIFPEQVNRAITLIRERNPVTETPEITSSDDASDPSLEPISVSGQ